MQDASNRRARFGPHVNKLCIYGRPSQTELSLDGRAVPASLLQETLEPGVLPVDVTTHGGANSTCTLIVI